MTWQVAWEPAALHAATGHLEADPAGVDALPRATDQLAQKKRPEGSRAWGSGHRRLPHGPWRVLYGVDTDTRTVHIEHVGRTGV
ncbi:hypothetical protein SHO565_21060 [Streptomyces sp. HO565]